jgi:protein gp37
VPFFFKQWGEWSPNNLCDPEVELMRRVGKKAAGAQLDGREWREMPRPDLGS